MKTKNIPVGHYCYEPIGWDGMVYKIKTCPHWERIDQYHAKCNLFNINDKEDGTLLWDQDKASGENYGDD